MAELIKSKLSELGEIVGGATPSTKNKNYFTDNGIAWITPKDLAENEDRYISHGEQDITREGLDSCSAKIMPVGSVLFTSRAPIGYVAIASNELCTNQGFKSIIPNKDVNSLFLYYLLIHNKDYIAAQGSGTTFKEVSGSTMKDIAVYIPKEVKDQKKIADFLGVIDSAIENNNTLSATLEEVAKTLYDYWFTQFDFPNEEGKPYRSSEGKMVWNEELKREIPEGWKVDNIYSITDLVNGLACQNYRPLNEDLSLPVIKIKEMHDGITLDTESVSANIPEKYIINDGDILFSWSATLEVAYWYGGKAGLNQHIFKVVPNKGFPKEYVYYQLQEYIGTFSKIALSRKTTMGHITSDHIKQSRISIAPIPVAKNYANSVSSTYQKILSLKKETKELISLRDFLLPLLMNGQVTIGE